MRNNCLLFFFMVCLLAGFTSCASKKQTGSSRGAAREASSKRAYYSKKFDVELDRESNLKLYEAVDQWIGVRYKYASCTKSGVDCSCLVNAIYRHAYQCNTPRDTKGLYERIRKLDADELKEGDLVFFSMDKKLDHVGVYLGSKKFVHASTKKGVMISSLEEPHFRKAFKTGGRFRCS